LKDARWDNQKLILGEESAFAGHVSTQNMTGYTIDKPSFQRLVTVILKPSTDLFSGALMERLGKHWLEALRGHFLEQVIQGAKVIECLSNDGASRTTFEYYSKLFEKLHRGLIKENIYNMDKMGILLSIQN
jgi:hypothetical protein